MLLFSHPTGNANVRAASLGLLEAGLLSEFHTTFATFPNSLLNRVSSIGPFAEIRRRSFDKLLEPVTIIHPWMEMGRVVALKIGLNSMVKHESGFFSIDAVYAHLDKQIASIIKRNAKKNIEGVYAYEDGALQTFRQAKLSGVMALYDLPIGYWRMSQEILEKEREIWPEWASTMSGLEDSTEKLWRKDEELAMADKIFVASSFTAKTLKHYPGSLAPIKIIPYGFPPVIKNRIYALSKSKPLKILFVGGLSQRKGIANLFAAVDNIGNQVILTVVGKKPDKDCPALNKALAKHTWMSSLPHEAILQLMRENDVFVFPSLFEGFGLVITEAMSQGTPVITTERTCGPDLISHGENGWLIEAGSVDQLQEAIVNLIDKPHLVESAGMAAMQTAENRPWRRYGNDLANAVMPCITR